MVALRARGGTAPLVLDLGSRQGCVIRVTPRPRFILWERTPAPPRYPRDRSLGGPSMDAQARRNILCPCRNQTPVLQAVVRHYTDTSTPAVKTNTGKTGTCNWNRCWRSWSVSHSYDLVLLYWSNCFILDRPNGFLLGHFPTEILHALLIFSQRSTCPTNHRLDIFECSIKVR